jgi:4-hydroxybenzoate polyprenyltransferase
VQIIFLLRFTAGAVIASGGLPFLDRRLLCGVLCWFLGTLFAYGINGICDIEEDRVNGSSRPIAAGLLPRSAASGLACSAAILSLVLAFASGSTGLVALDGGFLLIGYVYSAKPLRLKRTLPGASGSVLLMGILTYAAGWLVIDQPEHGIDVFVLGAAMSLWMCFVGAVTKDFAHVRGDMAAGHRNAVALLGDRGARRFGACGALAVAAGFLAAALRYTPMLIPSALVLCVGASVLALRCAAIRCGDEGSKGPYRVFMVTQYLVHAVLLVSQAG